MRRFTILSVALASVVGLLVGLILAGQFTPTPVVTTAPRVYPAADRPARPVLLAGGANANFADVVERINAAVVNIEATSNRGGGAGQGFLRRGDDVPRQFDGPTRGAGSGFVIDNAGFILTNHHVIDNAERITVTLADGRSFRGEVVGADPAIDVALLKINNARDLSAAPLGNSDDLRVGEWVCAIGNPLGYIHSVTVGVVSFIGRKLFDPSLDYYIQTDAAINFGNSGGPLINTRGEVIGINSAVSSRTNNIGFAVPINQAVAILPQLKAHGKVSRGFLGVGLTDVTPELRRGLNLSVGRGALVEDFTSDAPAERSGLRVYDVIVDVDGRNVESNDDLIRDISARQPGTVVKLQVLRDDKRISVPVRLAERPNPARTGADELPGGGTAPSSDEPEPPLGLTVRDLDRAATTRYNIPSGLQGVWITRVDPTGAAFSLPLKRGFVITEINRKPVRSVAEYDRVFSIVKPGDVLAIYFYDTTNAQRRLVTVTVER
ncbi:MAG: trypsin-like peptidase domain-containing protein [Acidobacteriota bacterium]|nr:trypsin-like peptidase domain-containing protein [Acidobacteriota bacterium]MDQ3417558.1 trypsin-like peptidase domain-containing protein [Acidobacteriota bacterium]